MPDYTNYQFAFEHALAMKQLNQQMIREKEFREELASYDHNYLEKCFRWKAAGTEHRSDTDYRLSWEYADSRYKQLLKTINESEANLLNAEEQIREMQGEPQFQSEYAYLDKLI